MKKEPESKEKGERIAKMLARAGVASRREAERIIEAGRVSVNGKILDGPAFLVHPGDKVCVDGKAVGKTEPTRLFMYHKPAGLVTSHKDERGRDTVFDKLPEGLPRLISVGRLDLNTEGLLLLTNDGELSRYLELPSTGWRRRYRVRAHGTITQDALDRLQQGITVKNVRYGPIEATLEREQGANCWISMALREGKNREIRRVMEHLGLRVNRLIRISYGPFQLSRLPEGKVREIEQKALHEQLGAFFKEQEK